MSRRSLVVVGTTAAALLLSPVPPAATSPAAPHAGTTTSAAPSRTTDGTGTVDPHERPDPLAARWATNRRDAVDELVTGDAQLVGRGPDRTIERSSGQEVEYPVSTRARLLTFLVEFGDTPDPQGRYVGATGPLRGEIPEPSANNNTTYWRASFDRAHFQDMFFDGLPDQDGQSMRDFYREASSGRFDLTGDTSDWVRVPHAQASYGTTENQADMTRFIADSATAWYQDRLAAGRTRAQIVDELASFDVWDRFDHDRDGDFNEPDGYIDHFQAVHAGVGQEAGGPVSSIWSHRWAANPSGTDGPPGAAFGGVQIGDTGFWIRDYTTEPENGGLGVFAHEFGHDLGLPDYYDTSSGANGVAFWSVMAQGSWLGRGEGAIGDAPGGFGASEKLFLGWFGPGNRDLTVVDGTGPATDVLLGPAHRATADADQAVLVALPDDPVLQTTSLGVSMLQSYVADNLDAWSISPAVTVPAGDPTLNARVRYGLEQGYDYANLVVRPTGSTVWTPVRTSLSSDHPRTPENLGGGITGSVSTWTPLTADLSAWAGQEVQVAWRVLTDSEVTSTGFAVDDVVLGDLTSDFTAGADGWNLQQFAHVDSAGQWTRNYRRYYLAENRQYRGYDTQLATGPYQWDATISNRVSSFPYQDGLLVWYSNSRYTDNNTWTHPGAGANLPVDANPALLKYRRDDTQAAGNGVSADRDVYDATFDVDTMDPLQHTIAGQTLDVPARPSVPVFEDTSPLRYTDTTSSSLSLARHVRLPATGAQIQVLESDEETGRMRIRAGAKFVAATAPGQVTGTPAVGEQLGVTDPTWWQNDVETGVQWLRDGVPVEGATGRTFEVTRADRGHRLQVRFTGTRPGWSPYTGETAAVLVPRDPATTPTTDLAVTGTAQVGQVLGALGATWAVEGTSTFTWTVAGQQVGSGPTLTVPASAVGLPVTLTETFSVEGTEDSVVSVATDPVARADAPSPTTASTISGTPRVGSVLRAGPATWPVPGTSTFTWRVGGTVLGTGATLRVPRTAAGRQVTLTETFTAEGTETAVATSTTATVARAGTRLRVGRKKLRAGRKARVTLVLSSAATPLTGNVRIVWKATQRGNGKRVRRTVPVRAGQVRVTLPARPRGRYRLTVRYSGDIGALAAKRTFRLRVR